MYILIKSNIIESQWKQSGLGRAGAGSSQMLNIKKGTDCLNHLNTDLMKKKGGEKKAMTALKY